MKTVMAIEKREDESRLRIGYYYLSSIIVPEGEKPPFHDEPHIFIQHESGEGMSVREDKLAGVIDRFYKENF